MELSKFDYELPEALIADHPAPERDASRLLVLPRFEGVVRHLHFRDLPSLLRPGDLLVVNDSKVLPARLLGKRRGSGGRVEILLLERHEGDGEWFCLVAPGRKAAPGTVLEFAEGLSGTIAGRGPEGSRLIRFEPSEGFLSRLERIGLVPLPPYILARRQTLLGGNGQPAGRSLRGKPELHEEEDRRRYQTVYARVPGSVAGPTAGLHFSEELLTRLQKQGVELVKVTLHVGLATFRPIQTETIEEHRMLPESFELPQGTVDAIRRCKERGGRVIAVGTTTVRVLEGVAAGRYEGARAEGLGPVSGRTDVFLTPGFRFQVIDGLITNFHLPRSTLLLLVSAFSTRERVLAAYREAVDLGYRFYSYGDAMLIQ